MFWIYCVGLGEGCGVDDVRMLRAPGELLRSGEGVVSVYTYTFVLISFLHCVSHHEAHATY